MTSAPDQTSADNRLEFLFLLLSLGNISSWNFRIFQFWQVKFVQILSPFFFSFEELGERERGYLVVHFLSFFLSFYLRDKKRNRKYKSLSPNDYGRNVTKAYSKDLIF